MLRKKTVFIIGAGASHEFGLPLGDELGKQIERSLDIRFEVAGTRFASGDFEIFEALRRHCQSLREGNVNTWLAACWRIRDALPHHNSIDNLIDNHAGDEKIALCGKLAIAKAILEAEKSSKLWFSHANVNNEIGFRSLEDTWIVALAKMLQEGVHRSDATAFFDNVAIVTFNYDRCIEHYFYRALRHTYGLPETDVAQIVTNATIRHVYGTVGSLPWQTTTRGVPFGGVGDADLLQCATSLRTFSEHQSGTKEGDEIHGLIAEAEVIVFLGFGFQETNIALLEPPLPRKTKADRILGSALKISDFDKERIIERLLRWFESGGRGWDSITLDNNATAATLLSNYGRAFS